MEKDNLIQTKSFDFSLRIIELYRDMKSQNEYILSKQILRSGTSIGANVEEAIGTQSRKDFKHKLSISRKEARETRYWLLLLEQSKLVNLEFEVYIKDVNELVRILTAIIKSLEDKPISN